LYEALESAFRIRRVYGAAVYDAEGEIVARVGAYGEESPTAEDVGRLAEEGRVGEYGRVGERRVYSYFVPLTSPGGRIEGLLQVTRRRSDIEDTLREVRLQLGVGFGVVWLLTAALVLFAYHRFAGRHFQRLSSAMAGVERGSRDARVAEGGPKELARIAGSFNRMVAGVQAAEAELVERRRREAALEARVRQSEKLAAIGRLAGGVAHELGTPLAVVDGIAQRLVRSGRSESEARAIREAVERMSGIVRELLAFGAVETGERQEVSVRGLLVGAVGGVHGEAEKRGVELETEEPRPDVRVRGDRMRLQTALMHLVRNAVQAAGAGGRVRVSAVEAAEGVGVAVEDSGPGVAEKARTHLFEPFFTTKPAGEGAGLGLAVVHSVAEEHGGFVEVGRSPLGGARFTLVLPRGDRDD
ncbi:MAG: sensor histidine kinase, partial [Gemmatimonadota bacterium]